MRRLGLFSALAFLLFARAHGQPSLTCKDGRCEKIIYGNAPAISRLKINAHGPVTVQRVASKGLTYVVRVSISARSEGAARRALENFQIRMHSEGPWTVLSAPGGPALSAISIKAPALAGLSIISTDGAVDASGVDGPVDVNTGAGNLTVDHVRGDCKLFTGGGNVSIGEIGGALHCTTGAGHINVRKVQGKATCETQGGDISIHHAGGAVEANTGGGGVRVGTAGGPVSATSGGGEIVVEKAGGAVTIKNMAGPVQVASAAGVRCESASGGVSLSNISGPMRVQTSMGTIVANLLGSQLADSYLATGAGDIIVSVPSNVGVTIRAQNNMADTLRRIVSDYRELQAQIRGSRVVAEGSLNGGGPVLQITAMGGVIAIKRQ
jgi:DUF4097 and DUF4098 domain-containing protein YvlB